jgi:LCP family protein required for cell wall assembly
MPHVFPAFKREICVFYCDKCGSVNTAYLIAALYAAKKIKEWGTGRKQMTKKNERKSNGGVQKSVGKKKHRLRWWIFPVGAAVLIIIAAVTIYINITMRIYRPTKLVNTWSDIPSTTSSVSSTTPSTDPSDGNYTISDSSFNNIKSENYPIIKISQKNKDVENILLIGIDGDDPRQGMDIGHRSDCMIVLSINTKNHTIKLTSLLRDIKAYFPDQKAWAKLNAAYAYGGAGQAINIINYNFKLDIQQYVLVNFSGFQSIVNAAGGVSISVTKKEAKLIPGLSGAGTYTLNGPQALAYSRIRDIDSDFVRTQRQRTVLTSLFNKLNGESLVQKTEVANQFLNYISTNIPTSDLMGKLLNVSSKMSGDIEQMEAPDDTGKMYTLETSPVFYFDIKWPQEVKAVSDFIYGS